MHNVRHMCHITRIQYHNAWSRSCEINTPHSAQHYIFILHTEIVVVCRDAQAHTHTHMFICTSRSRYIYIAPPHICGALYIFARRRNGVIHKREAFAYSCSHAWIKIYDCLAFAHGKQKTTSHQK